MTSSLNVARDGSASGPQDFKSQYPRGVPKCIANYFIVLKKQARARSLHNAIMRCKTHGNRPAFFLQNEKRRGQKTPCSEPGNPPYRQTPPLGRHHQPDGLQNASPPRRTIRIYLISFYTYDDSQLGRMRQIPAQRVHVHTPFARHGDARMSSTAAPLFFGARHPKRFDKMRRLHCHCMVKVQPVYPVFRRRAHD